MVDVIGSFEITMVTKKYLISEKRFVVVKKDEIAMFEDATAKKATFSYPRWAQFVENLEEIDNAVLKLVKGEEDVKLQLHIGGAWYVSVTSGFRCIDLRKFFMGRDGTVKPMKTGFAIRLSEWDRVKQITRNVKEQCPKVADAAGHNFNQECIASVIRSETGDYTK